MRVVHGNNMDVLRSLEESSIDSIVTDPPYGLSFMGKKWDHDVPSVELWRECLRVLKPGGHLLSFGGTRTYHRLVVNIEDAGFEIRDQLQWITGQGFPKNLNVLKAALKEGIACGCKEKSKHDVRQMQCSDLPEGIDSEDQLREVLQPVVSQQGASTKEPQTANHARREQSSLEGGQICGAGERLCDGESAESSESEAQRLCSRTYSCSGEDARATIESGRGSPPHQSRQSGQQTRKSQDVLKSSGTLDGSPFPRCPKCEKPILPEGLGSSLKPANEPICLARKPLSEKTVAQNVVKWGTGGINVDATRIGTDIIKTHGNGDKYSNFKGDKPASIGQYMEHQGRWPANVLFDEEAAEMLDEQSIANGIHSAGKGRAKKESFNRESGMFNIGHAAGCSPRFEDSSIGASRFFYVAKASKRERGEGNGHPTVKPIKLMEYLVTLITPPNGVVLDPFMGSGTTGIAAKSLGFEFVGIEVDADYMQIATRRLQSWLRI